MKKIILLVCALALLTSCGTKKHLPKPVEGEIINTVSNAEKTQYETILAKSFDFENLSAKAKYSFNGASLSGKFFVEHAKRLAMTMTVLGIEVVRIEADTKTVTLVNKLDKIYATISINEFAEKLGMKDEMRFDALEALFLGRMFIPGEGEAKAKDFKQFAMSFDTVGSFICRIRKEKYELNYYSTPNSDARLESTEVIAKHGDGGKNFSCKYENYVELGDGELPTSISFSSTLIPGLTEDKALANFSLSNPTLNGKPLAAFKPTDAYKEVSFKEFVEAVKNLKN